MLALFAGGLADAVATTHTVTWSSNPTTNTTNINNALNNAAYTKVVLPYNSAGWSVYPLFMKKPQELWIAGSGSNPGKLLAAAGGFTGQNDSLITVHTSGATINGYANGTSKTSGVALLQMRRADYLGSSYTPSEWRHGVRLVGEYGNFTMKGLLIKDTGGDGIWIGGGTTGSGYTIVDVTTDNAYRNGISVISADSMYVQYCTFKNTNGTDPQSGVDFEPNNASERLTNIEFWDCTFSNNAKDGVHSFFKYCDSDAVSIRLYRCNVDASGARGLAATYMLPTGPAAGSSYYFQSAYVSNSARQGLHLENWHADHARVTLNSCTITHAADLLSSVRPIYVGNASSGGTAGEVLIQNASYIYDFNSSHVAVIGSPTGYEIKDITGGVTVDRNNNLNGHPILGWGDSTPVNVTLSVTEINP